MVKARFDASIDELSRVIDLVNETILKAGWSNALLPVMDVAVEEIFVNIASYAYQTLPDADKYADITIDAEDDRVTIVFEDEGIEYNPLLRDDPDVTLPAGDRKIGGLGIYMVKKSMDGVTYACIDGKNVFTIMKKRTD